MDQYSQSTQKDIRRVLAIKRKLFQSTFVKSVTIHPTIVDVSIVRANVNQIICYRAKTCSYSNSKKTFRPSKE